MKKCVSVIYHMNHHYWMRKSTSMWKTKPTFSLLCELPVTACTSVSIKWRLYLFTKCFIVYRFTLLTLWIERESERQSKSFRFCFWTFISLSQIQWSLTYWNLILNVFQAIIRDPFMLNAVILVFANKQDMVSLWNQWVYASTKCI